MGTSLSGLTPATTFDGLLKVGDNDPLTADLKAISTGDGTDTILSLSNSALSIGGTVDINFAGQTNVPMQFYGAGAQLHYISGGNNLNIEYVTTAINENVRLAYAVSNRDVSIGQSSSMGAKLGIKGSGATSATTSLLVQNSAGTDMLKVQDDSSLLMYRAANGAELLKITESGGNAILYANGNANRSLVLGYQNTLTAFNQTEFKTYNGTGYSEAMVITGNSNTSQFVGIGETTPTARLHVKGSGATSATTSLLVQNSTGADVLQTLDNGSVGVGGPANSSYRVTMTSGVLRLKDLLFGQADSTAINNTSLLTMKWNGSTGIGISSGGAIDAAARLHVKGSGNDATTTALLVQNSDGTTLFDLKDSGLLSSALNMSNNNVVKFNGQNALRGSTTANEVTIAEGFNFQNTIIDDSQLTVKGRGATSATTALLVENSAGTDLLKVEDAGKVTFGGLSFSGGAITGNAYFSNIVYGPNFYIKSDGSTTIGSGSGAAASSILDVRSTTKGFLPPRMTDAERDAIATPAAGLMIYDTANNQMNYWNGSTWIAF